MNKKHFDLVLDCFAEVVKKYLSDPNASPDQIARFVFDLNVAMQQFKTTN